MTTDRCTGRAAQAARSATMHGELDGGGRRAEHLTNHFMETKWREDHANATGVSKVVILHSTRAEIEADRDVNTKNSLSRPASNRRTSTLPRVRR
jgi:hypothetical protein